ncbi:MULTISPECIES: large conductance mechanosensitive channel protein MscL [Microbacterium]|uniref:large conductance mechanosensitive channel protein MscL n=1 Tax=Microbacterium TaxID=33882 RepID=UPI002785C74A|nr:MULTISPECIES: large conductance mechanosensitive channel protein MscL [Microbacterium]MDQ1084577.1 large conductance mechanosensitive channel [Microbacterium sp. SORGH_AS_0344]MDQ1170145.1 large conductance mechanosensitive channel [Microbacterium proteolyticum]
MIKGFKEFILRGNVIDLAVAVVIGAAFTAIVNAMVQGLINPLIGFLFQVGDLSDLNLTVNTIFGGTSTFEFGNILVAIINFLAVAAIVYFVFVFPMNRWKERAAARAGVAEAASEEPKLPTEQELLVQIRDLLDRQNDKA